MRAICYLRFSSEGQADGSSFERQKEHVQDYCKRTGLEIVKTLEDPGLSAYKGDHLATGELGKFFKDADKGLYRGYALVIEHLDRLSRGGIKATFDLIERLLLADVQLHETQSNRIYHSLDDLGTAITAVVDGHAAKLYSKKLSERVTKGWGNAKREAANGRIVTSKVPFWLSVEDGKIVPVPEKVADVREAFRLAALGHGSHKISRAIGGRIAFSTLGDLLRNRSVLGEYQACKFDVNGKRIPDGDVVHNYFPSVISQSEFDAAREHISSRFRSGNRRGSSSRNLFGGIIFDVTDAPERGLRLNGNGRGYLESAFDGTRKTHRIRIDRFENAFLHFLKDLDWRAVAGEKESPELKQSLSELDTVNADLDKAIRLIARRTEQMTDPDLPDGVVKEFASQIVATKARVDTLLGQQLELHDRCTGERAKAAALYSPEELLSQIRVGNEETRLKLRNEIRKRISRIDFTFNAEIVTATPKDEIVYEDDGVSISRAGNPTGIKPGTGRTIVRVKFINDAEQWMIFQEDDAVLLYMARA